MKTYNNLIEPNLTDEEMDEALSDACKRKTERPEVQELIEKKDVLKIPLRNKIRSCDLKPIIHKAFVINDGFKQKKRLIIKPYLTPTKPELWIQHIVVRALKPMFTKGMYIFSCGSIPGRGIHYGKKYLEKFIRNNPKEIKYVLKLDIKHFYESVDIDLLKEKFREKIKDKVLLNLIYFVLDSNIGTLPDGTVVQKGLPIGFYTSQWFANWFLQPFDHYVKEELKSAFYMRYMDDLVIFGSNKRKLHKDFIKIEKYLATLHLQVKENWQVFRFDYIDADGNRRGRPVDYMGFKFYRDKTTIRKSIFLRACRKARRIKKKLKLCWRDACQLLSYMGWFLTADSFMAYKQYIEPNVSVEACRKVTSNHDKRRKNGHHIQTSSEQHKANGA